RLREQLETAPVPLDGARAHVRSPRARLRGLRRVVADEELDLRRLVPREPSGAFDRRMSAGSGVDDDEYDALVLRHGTPHVARCIAFILRSRARWCSLNAKAAYGNYV